MYPFKGIPGRLVPGVMVAQCEALAVTTGILTQFIWFALFDLNHQPLGPWIIKQQPFMLSLGFLVLDVTAID